ncbi:hypothetical protein F5X99DRAFT_375738 [Biscogniauxia marginata]|nr:hypothetical protein F5X99DRAFT_375738 [Biscogniauxia marginata]
MGLCELPNEIITEIIIESRPDGFENFLLTCKRFYYCGEHLIEHHNSLKSELDVYNCNILDGSCCRSVSHLRDYCRLASNNLYARYVKTMDFNPHRSSPSQYLGSNYLSMEDNNLESEIIKQCVAESSYLRISGANIETWQRHILPYGSNIKIESHIAFTSTFLMTLLPNVKTILLPFGLEYAGPSSWPTYSSSEDLEVWEVMKVIRRNIENNPNGAALRKLTRLYMVQNDWYGPLFQMDTLYPFLALPNLTYLFANLCTATKGTFSYEVPISDMSSSLRTVELYHCFMNCEGVSQVLSKLPHLISFRYSNYGFRGESDFDAGGFVAAVGKQVGDRLEDLSVDICMHDGDITTGVVSMDEFTKLKRLELDCRVFYGPSIESGERIGKDPKDPKPEYDKWTIQAIPSIYKILPRSLERLDLYIWDHGIHPNPHVKGLKRLLKIREPISEGMLPQLKVFRVGDLRGGHPYLDTKIENSEVFKYFQSCGVECELSSGTTYPSWIKKLLRRLSKQATNSLEIPHSPYGPRNFQM